MLRSFLILAFLIGLTACSGGDGGGSGGGGNDPHGDFSYDLNDNGCHTVQNYSSKSAYCAGLQDQQKNHGCALDERKDMFTKDCDGNFQELNFSGGSWSGFDPRLQTDCPTQSPGSTFANVAQYCQFLQNEDLHHRCHWSERKAEFNNYNCEGPFSPEPARVTPAPTPVPTPIPTPGPTPDDRPQVVKDLEAAGISVREAPLQGTVMPRVPDYYSQLRSFYEVLEQVEPEILQRKQYLKHLVLTEYTSFSEEYQDMSLDVYLTRDEILGYFKLFDERLLLEKRTQMRFDFGIDIFGEEQGDKLQNMRSMLALLEANASALASMTSFIQTLKLDDYSSVWAFDKSLHIRRDSFTQDLPVYIQKIKPILPLFNILQQQGIAWECKYDFDKNYEGLVSMTSKLYGLKDSLSLLHRLKKLAKITLEPGLDKTYYFGNDGELSPAGSGEEFTNLTTELKALATAFQYGKSLSIDVSLMEGAGTLDKNLPTGVAHLGNHLEQIRRKAGSIQSIVLWSSNSDFSAETLYVGCSDRDADLAAVLQKIP